MSDLSGITTLAFDVGGTVVDWHGGITAQLAGLGAERGVAADWPAVTKAWRTAALERALNAATADLPRGNIDGVHRETLDPVLEQFDLSGSFGDDDREAMTHFWHELDSWPDAARGHARLKTKFVMSTLTILSVSLIVDISRRAPFHWDAVISCEMLERYKLDPLPYREGPRILQCQPDQVLMVAAHNFDLLAAAKEGLKTAFIKRPDEWGKGTTPEPEPDTAIDIVADDLEDLADKLGCA